MVMVSSCKIQIKIQFPILNNNEYVKNNEYVRIEDRVRAEIIQMEMQILQPLKIKWIEVSIPKWKVQRLKENVVTHKSDI